MDIALGLGQHIHMKNDPAKIEGVANILREAFPRAAVTVHDTGIAGPIAFTIRIGDEEPRILRISWERLQEDQDQTERFVSQATVTTLQPGKCWLLKADGTMQLCAEAPRE